MLARPAHPGSGSESKTEAIVIGASAGAIEALGVVLPPLSRDLRVPVIIVVHLSSRRPSLLPDLFRSRCRAPVCEPLDKQPVIGGTIWFAPSGYHLLIELTRSFAVSIDPPVKYSRPALDVLFESAADAYGAGLIAVVLSGANDDGALGAAAVRKHGGRVYVQRPEEALAPAMPKAAIRQAQPQFVGTLEEIAALLCDATGQST
jgi:two-component system, chemotaxis family, protein-glutamate methylesterase/glutaminase